MKQIVGFKNGILLTVLLAFIFTSCATRPDTHAHLDAGVRAGTFEEMLTRIDRERTRPARETIYTSRNDILFYLDRGMIAHFAGLYQESFQNLERAERLIEEAFTRSITQDLASFVLSDNTRDYSGRDYEDLYINIFNALNRYHLGDLEGAMVEIRRLNEKLVVLADRYQRAVERLKQSDASLDATNLEASRFSNSALARYMGILFHRAIGNTDGVRIEHEELQRAFSLAPEVYTHPIPSSVGEELSVPAGMARLNIIAFTGLAPVKEEHSIMIPLPFAIPNHETRVALPQMVRRPQVIQRVEVVLDSGERFNLELIEDIGSVAIETFRSTYTLTVLRSTARAIARTTAGAAGARVARERGGAVAGFAAGMAGRLISEGLERADIRLSRYFPNHALVGGTNLEPGNHMITVNFYGARGLIESERREISVQSNALNLKQFVHISDADTPSPARARAPVSVAPQLATATRPETSPPVTRPPAVAAPPVPGPALPAPAPARPAQPGIAPPETDPPVRAPRPAAAPGVVNNRVFFNTGIGIGPTQGYDRGVPPISGSLDFRLSDAIPISLGAILSYNTWESSTGLSPYRIEVTYRNIGFGARAMYHFLTRDNFNVYTGITLGWVSQSARIHYGYGFFTGPRPSISSDPFFLFGANVGARFFFTNRIGVFSELGYSGLQIFNAGLTIRF